MHLRELVNLAAMAPLAMLLSGCMAQEHRLTYLALGDSYTIGEAVSEQERFPMQLAARLRERGVDLCDPTIVATTGWTTEELLKGISQRSDLETYDLVTLLIGVNNQYRGLPLDIYRKELRGLLSKAIGFAKNRKDRVLMVSIPDYGLSQLGKSKGAERIARELDMFNQAARVEAKAQGVVFVDITPASREAGKEPGGFAPDGLHPSASQYGAWVKEILPYAEAALRNSE